MPGRTTALDAWSDNLLSGRQPPGSIGNWASPLAISFTNQNSYEFGDFGDLPFLDKGIRGLCRSLSRLNDLIYFSPIVTSAALEITAFAGLVPKSNDQHCKNAWA